MLLKDVASITALRALLARDRKSFAETEPSSPDRSVADQFVTLIDRLDGALRERRSIGLTTARSAEAATWDGNPATVGGYLGALLRDEYDRGGAGWDQLADLSRVVIEVRPFARPSAPPAIGALPRSNSALV